MLGRPREEIGYSARDIAPEEAGADKRETPAEQPRLTLFLLRHGQSEEDKLKPNRGLTEHGQEQVKKAMQAILAEIAFEEEGENAGPKSALGKVEFHLRDSGTERTLQQVALEHGALREAGVPEENIILPKKVLEYMHRESGGAGPGITKRLQGVRGIEHNPEFRRKIQSPEFQKQLGATSSIEAWALAPDDQIPEGVETRAQMETRYRRDVARAERVIARKTAEYPRRVVTIANSHASMATVAAASELGVPLDQLMKKIGEMPEAEGLRYDFYGPGAARKTRPFGENIEQAFAQPRPEQKI